MQSTGFGNCQSRNVCFKKETCPVDDIKIYLTSGALISEPLYCGTEQKKHKKVKSAFCFISLSAYSLSTPPSRLAAVTIYFSGCCAAASRVAKSTDET